MSGCFKVNERIQSRDGIVKDVTHNDRGYYVVVEFEKLASKRVFAVLPECPV